MRKRSASLLRKTKTWAGSAILLLVVSIGVSGLAPAFAGSVPSNSKDNRAQAVEPARDLSVNPPGPSEVPANFDYLSGAEFRLALLISAISFLTLLMLFFLLRGVPRLKAEDSLRTFGVVLIIMGTLFFVAAGFSAEQIAPAIGLFGTIAGYLLGKIERKSEEQNNA
ncbi:MAG: hypothetical protein WAM70_08690 [Pyrinomonadaceae bacterium]